MKLRWLAIALAVAVSACSGGNPVVPNGPTLHYAYSRAGTRAAASYSVAPYVDMQSGPPPQLATYAAETGTRYYTMSFIQGYKNTQCEGAWGGTVLPADPTNGPYFAKQLAAIRAAGGDGIISFGGAAGSDLASRCSSVASLAKAYEAVIDYYHVTHVDFDIEGNQPYDTAAVARRSAALHLVLAHYSAISGAAIALSYTLPVNPTGLPNRVLGVVRSAVKAGVTLSIVNVMTMDYGDGAAPNPQGKMGSYAIEAATSTAKQLKSIGFPLGTNAYASVGITPMIGQNDVKDEVFEPADASKLVHWAAAKGIGRLSFWAQQRDKMCKKRVNHAASDTCSGIVQQPYTFGRLFAAL